MRRIVLAGLLVLAACSTPFGLDWARVVGVIDPSLSSVQTLRLPTEVRAGVAFTATVTTLGSSSCTRSDGAAVTVEGALAEITPFDRRQRGALACTDDLAPFPRDVQLTFAAPGDARIVVIGRTLSGAPTSFEVTVPVLP